MPYSYNSWSASPNLAIRDLVVAGVEIVPGVRDDDDVHAVFTYIAQEWNDRVEPLVKGWCWGFSYRLTTNDDSLSCHASGTAIDLNAPLHPYGVDASRNLTPAQIAEVHKIRDEVGCVVWGGDYRNAQDAMHWELSGTKAEVAAAAARLRNQQEDIVTEDDINKVAAAVLAKRVQVTKPDGTKTTKTVEALIRETWQKTARS